jgi:hypothetical protein
MIKFFGTGLIFRNPKPHVHSIHAYFPSVVRLEDGTLLCSLVFGAAFESPNCRTHVSRSTDEGGARGNCLGNCYCVLHRWPTSRDLPACAGGLR